MKTLTSLLTKLKSRSRRGNEADDSGRANHGIRLLTSSATGRALTKLTLAAVLLTTIVAARADWVSGYTRSNGTYVAPHYRTPANGSVYDNLSYRCYPSQQPGYVSPRSYGYGDYDYSGDCESYSSPVSIYGRTTRIGDSTFYNYSTSDGGGFSGSTITIGDSSFTTIYGW